MDSPNRTVDRLNSHNASTDSALRIKVSTLPDQSDNFICRSKAFRCNKPNMLYFETVRLPNCDTFTWNNARWKLRKARWKLKGVRVKEWKDERMSGERMKKNRWRSEGWKGKGERWKGDKWKNQEWQSEGWRGERWKALDPLVTEGGRYYLSIAWYPKY